MAEANDSIEKVLNERQSSHGLFRRNALFSQEVKDLMRQERNWDGPMGSDMKEAADYIIMKLARILEGDPYHIDHWVDIAGYATLVADRLRQDNM